VESWEYNMLGMHEAPGLIPLTEKKKEEEEEEEEEKKQDK
jgi:hypothetical protein